MSTIPTEDIFYGSLLILANIALFERFREHPTRIADQELKN